jgi:2-polyprenyl-6-methoxyphenol hydroxylase-like FAD-dependent oxidoreductase
MPTDAPGDFPGKDRSVFTIEEAASEDDSRHHLQRLLEERAPWFEGTVKELNWSTDIQFEHRLARQFGRNRCWLAGDAAHQTGPVGMQSLNVGLREAADLAGRTKKILREKASEDLLQAYNSDRQAEWQWLLGLKGGPKPAESSDPWIKQHYARIPACLPASGEDLTVLLKRLGLDFK